MNSNYNSFEKLCTFILHILFPCQSWTFNIG